MRARGFGIKIYGRRLQNKSKNQSVSLGIGQYPVGLEKKGKIFTSKILLKIANSALQKHLKFSLQNEIYIKIYLDFIPIGYNSAILTPHILAEFSRRKNA